MLAGSTIFTVTLAGQGSDSSLLRRIENGERMLAGYFAHQVKEIETDWLQGVSTRSDWERRREEFRRQLMEMLGLWPLPERTQLQATVTGVLEGGDFIVEKLHFQSLPGLYVTADLFRPRQVEKPLPAVLYLCGHSRVKNNGISYGNKVAYHHHPAWFARHGYVSLIIDTLQLGEIEGLHHGTNREGMWWWNARGYTPAGVETWNAMRAIDYLQTRPEVDPDRIGVTGRSGGGAYSWWLAALDERVKAAVPVAGITDLQNYVVDGAIEGHCDCMFMVNTYRWDFPRVAALVAPRPLLIANSDKDPIFPLDGVQRLHWKVRHIYRLYGAEDRLGLLITEGPHKDTQELQIPAFHWMNRWLKGQNPLIERPAVPFFQPEQLRVFSQIPSDEITSRVHESFIGAVGEPSVPAASAAWETLRDAWFRGLKEKSFAGWPDRPPAFNTEKILELAGPGMRLAVYDFDSQENVRLRLWIVLPPAGLKAERALLLVTNDAEWEQELGGISALFADQAGSGKDLGTLDPIRANAEKAREIGRRVVQENTAVVIFGPRGSGISAWDSKKETHIRRRFVLLGQTLDGMRVWDVRRAVAWVANLEDFSGLSIQVQSRGKMAGVALYASLFEPAVERLDLWSLPASHHEGPTFLNVLTILDVPQAVALALQGREIFLHETDPASWRWPLRLARNLSLESHLDVSKPNF